MFNELFLTCIQMVNFDRRGRYGHWVAHVNGATALLELRGKEEFTERGALLYLMIRSQIVSPLYPFRPPYWTPNSANIYPSC